MAQVPEKTLAWLYNVVHDYRDSQRTYADAAKSLSSFPTLAPRTEVHTFENGSSSLLLTLSGTLPTTFRGTLYHFPIKIWMPRSYPQEPPFLYVTPSKEMQVRIGQHVGDDGRIYHPYLRDWSGMWDRATIAELLGYIQQVFSREPPVTARSHQVQNRVSSLGYTDQPRQITSPAGAPRLPPKPGVGNDGVVQTPQNTGPPPRPPKPDERPSYDSGSAQSGPPLPPLPNDRRSSMQPRNGPPLPPLPGQRPAMSSPYGISASTDQDRRAFSQPQLYARPTLTQQVQPASQYQVSYERSPVSPIHQPNGASELPDTRRISFTPNEPSYDPRRQSQIYTQGSQHLRQQPVPQQYVQPVQKQPVPDLLSDSLEVKLPMTVAYVQAPPVPVNPEKEHLLHALSTTLVQQAQQRVQQNVAALAPLQTQQNALRAAYSQLESELAQLQALDAAIVNNEAILRRTIQDCDRTIDKARTMSQPPIDDVLVAPTLVAQQLWTASVDEAACREAMYVLQKAVDRGRINGSDFVRQMRGLGRECFLKMALARKCAQGLGLDLAR